MQRIDLIFQRLERVITLFFGAGARVAFDVRDLPLFCGQTMFLQADVDIGRQHFIDAIQRRAAINMAGDLRDNLRGHRRGGGD